MGQRNGLSRSRGNRRVNGSGGQEKCARSSGAAAKPANHSGSCNPSHGSPSCCKSGTVRSPVSQVDEGISFLVTAASSPTWRTVEAAPRPWHDAIRQRGGGRFLQKTAKPGLRPGFLQHSENKLEIASVIGCGAADSRQLSHTEHCTFASQRRLENTPFSIPSQSPVLGTRGTPAISQNCRFWRDGLAGALTTATPIVLQPCRLPVRLVLRQACACPGLGWKPS